MVERFGIKRIGELYGSTEGNSNIGEVFVAFGSVVAYMSDDSVDGRSPRRGWLLSRVFIPRGRLSRCPCQGSFTVRRMLVSPQ